MEGSSTNVSDGKRLEIHLIKLSDDTNSDRAAALDRAIEYRKSVSSGAA